MLRLPCSAYKDTKHLSLVQMSDFQPWFLIFLGLPHIVLLLNYLAYQEIFLLLCLSPQIYKLEDMDPVFRLLSSAQKNAAHIAMVQMMMLDCYCNHFRDKH